MKHPAVPALLLTLALAAPALALDANERGLFGLTELEQTRPDLDGSGFSIGVCDTEFDVTHSGLGWTGGDEYSTWFYNRQYIPMLNRRNPRIYSAAHDTGARTAYTFYHGARFRGFELPVSFNNTLMTNIWSFHGTAVAGTAAGGQSGPLGNSLGAAPRARLVLAGNSASFPLVLSQVPDGNPTRTVAMNRSFTGSSGVESEARRNSGVIGVNAAGNYFSYLKKDRTAVYGVSPHTASIRWLDKVGYDLIASGLTVYNAGEAAVSGYGSMRNQESIFTDYSVRTLRPDGVFDAYASGTSFASPLLAGGVTLVQQAYATARPGRWLRTDQMQRILKRSGRFVDGPYTGLRFPVADFAAAVALAETYEGDPSFEPNFSTSFDPEPRVNQNSSDPYFLNPLQFRVETAYGSNYVQEFTAAAVEDGALTVRGNTAGGSVNIALRNGWGDLARIDLTEPGKTFTARFRYQTSAGGTGGQHTEFYIGIKEMVGSVQFMDENRMSDNTDRGRLAFRITYNQGDDTARVDLLQCTEAPVTSNPYFYEPVWQRTDYHAIPRWESAPLATVYVGGLHTGTNPEFEAVFTARRAILKINGNTSIDIPHNAPQIGLSRSTPYMHFFNSDSDCRQAISDFEAVTESGPVPVITREDVRLRAVEGVNGPTAKGVIKVRRTTAVDQPLTVYYHVTGTAANGADYTYLPGSITIPAHVASADIEVTPLNDTLAEGDETVFIDITPNGSYIISPYSDTGSVTIVDYADIDGDGLMSWEEDINRNGDLTDDDSNANMLPNYLDVHDAAPTSNVPPVADAGSDAETTGTDAVSLDGSASYDVDGTITAYAWSILPGDNGPVELLNADTAAPSVRWNDPTELDRTIQIQLTVTDNHGATAVDTVAVTQKSSPIYFKTYNQVYFRGSPNGWTATRMELVDHHTWELMVTVGGGSQTFKFDIYGDWSLNFGDNNSDGYVDREGGNIPFREGEGSYVVRFNDQHHTYSVSRFIPNQPPVADAGDDLTTFQMEPVNLDGTGSYDPDGVITGGIWTIIEGAGGPVYITNVNSTTPTIGWHAPTIGSRTAVVELVVTDNDGASSTDRVTVIQTSVETFESVYPQVYLRGTPNGWGTSAMTLVDDYTWELTTVFAGGNDNRFKLDIYGNWSLNFGDNNSDGYADQGGGDIVVTQGEGIYTIQFNDQTRRYTVTRYMVNQPPVADAGNDQEVGLEGASVQLNGSGSYDPDGSIVSYRWSQVSGPAASLTGTGNETANAVILSRLSDAVYVFALVVTDDDDLSSTSTVSVIQKEAGFDKVYDQVYFRGTPNGWGAALMTLVSNHIWETEQTFGSGSGERFKLDVHGDWRLNFGDFGADGFADQDGTDIYVTQGAGTYIVRFNDETRQYWVNRTGGTFSRIHDRISAAGSMNGWNPAADNMTLIDHYTWSGTFTLSGTVELKLTGNGSWGVNWGENNQPGTSAPLNGWLEGGGGNIRLVNLPGATYRITMNEQTLAYSVTVLTGTEAGAGRTLVGWEARYGLDLLAAGNSARDDDLDLLSNLDEYHIGTNPFRKDTDMDGICDRGEIIAATDPVNANDVLAATVIMTEGGAVLSWPCASARLYRLEASRDMTDWRMVTEWMAPETAEGYLRVRPPEGYTYFRVQVGESGVIGTTD